MAMFDKATNETESSMSPGTVVGGNVKLTGTLKDVNDITIHGQVDGEIISDRVVTIAETARVKGPITATSVTIAGTVNGAVTASERCELLPSARVSGSVTTADLSIKSGALFNGKATMAATERTSEPSLSRDTEPTYTETETVVIEEPPMPEELPVPDNENAEGTEGSATTPSATPTAEFED